jgi:hypothetical protein
MKLAFAALILALATVAGCHAQMPPTAPVYTCPATTGTAYTPLNAPASNTVPASITGTTYDDLPGLGTWCYVIQSWAIVSPATVYQDSMPTVAVMAMTNATLNEVVISWTAPPGAVGYTYIVSRAPAVLAPSPFAPANPSATAQGQ